MSFFSPQRKAALSGALRGLFPPSTQRAHKPQEHWNATTPHSDRVLCHDTLDQRGRRGEVGGAASRPFTTSSSQLQKGKKMGSRGGGKYWVGAEGKKNFRSEMIIISSFTFCHRGRFKCAMKWTPTFKLDKETCS